MPRDQVYEMKFERWLLRVQALDTAVKRNKSSFSVKAMRFAQFGGAKAHWNIVLFLPEGMLPCTPENLPGCEVIVSGKLVHSCFQGTNSFSANVSAIELHRVSARACKRETPTSNAQGPTDSPVSDKREIPHVKKKRPVKKDFFALPDEDQETSKVSENEFEDRLAETSDFLTQEFTGESVDVTR